MNLEVQVPRPSWDAAKLGVSAFLIVCGIATFYYFAESPRLIRILAVVGTVLAAAFIAAQTARGRALVGFARETQIEVRKVVWPSRQETIQTTGVVILIVVIMAILLWLLDMLLSGFTRWLIGHGG
jgi:preprotein translocase subunit SecE